MAVVTPVQPGDRVLPRILQAAIGLAAMHFSLGDLDDGRRLTTKEDVCFVLDGHLDCWQGWSRLSRPDAVRFARLLRRRPNHLANAESARVWLDRLLLDSADIPGCTASEDYKDSGGIVVAPGMSLAAFVDDALNQLDSLESQRERCLPPAGLGHHTTATRVQGPGTSTQHFATFEYEIADHHLGAVTAPPVLIDAPTMDTVDVPFEELKEIATLLDTKWKTTYRADTVRKFQKHLKRSHQAPPDVLDLAAGRLNELLAYTGFGKSVVLVEVLACWAVMKRIPIAFVVPTNADVVRTAYRIQKNAEAFRAEVSVVPLMSPYSMIDVARTSAARSGEDSVDPLWIWEKLGYGCALPAVGTTQESIDRWQPGREPCARLRKPRKGKKDETVACPWRAGCGKFRQARQAVIADVIVTSHVNLMVGRLHAPVEDGLGINDRLTVEEVLVRHCPIIVIDEVDEFQRTAIDKAGRGLTLDHGGQVNTPLRRFDAEFGAAFGRFHEDVDANVRNSYFMLRFLSENYVSHLSYGRIAGPAASRNRSGPIRFWTVPRRSDSWLTAVLFGLDPESKPRPELTATQSAMFRSLFLGEDGADDPLPDEPAIFPDLRKHLHAVVRTGVESRALVDVRLELNRLLAEVPSQNRGKTVNRLLRRAILEQARVHLHALMANATQLLDMGVESAQEIADALGAYNRWQATPTGPLGRLVFAFRENLDLGGREPARLTTAAFGGDPHTYLVGLGDVTALAHTRTRRVVLGLSATSYFPRAPHHHVFVKPRWWVPDVNSSQVEVVATPITIGESDLLKISGVEGSARNSALRTLGKELWTQHLEAELKRLETEDPDRPTVLIATTSYLAAELVADGLSLAGVPSHLICLAVPPADAVPGQTEAVNTGKWLILGADRLEQFPKTPARILIAPLARVQRGVNIIGKADKSALGSVWLVVRPIPLIDEPAELVAHLQARAIAEHHRPASDPRGLLELRRNTAGTYFEEIIRHPPYFRSQPADVKTSVVAEIMNGAIQLIGRARRGGTSAVLHLVDGAFLDQSAGTDFATLVRVLRQEWRQQHVLDEMKDYYGSTLQAFFDFADRPDRTDLEEGPSSC